MLELVRVSVCMYYQIKGVNLCQDIASGQTSEEQKELERIKKELSDSMKKKEV